MILHDNPGLLEAVTFQNDNIIYNDGVATVSIPKETPAPEGEGTHLRISSCQETAPYYTEEGNINDILQQSLRAYAASRALLGISSLDEHGVPTDENSYYWNQWINVHFLPRFGGQDQTQIEVFGRNARDIDKEDQGTWAKPVHHAKVGEDAQRPQSVYIKEIDYIEGRLGKDLEDVLKESENFDPRHIFDEPSVDNPGLNDPESLCRIGRYDVRMVTNSPHIENGIHLWIKGLDPETPEGVFSNVKRGLESTIMSIAVARIIYRNLGVKMEVHYSGNWGLPTHDRWKETLGVHANMYGVYEENSGLGPVLPDRPGTYNYPPYSAKEREKFSQLFKKELRAELENIVSQIEMNKVQGNG